MDMSGIRKYFDHQDGWGADGVECVVDLSTKVLEVFTLLTMYKCLFSTVSP